MTETWPHFADDQILAARPPRNPVDPTQAYAFFVEREFQPAVCTGGSSQQAANRGQLVENVATVFLTNQECPFRCLMCDLWKNTTTDRVGEGAISSQIRSALIEMAAQGQYAQHIKLYNSANFFDPQSIPDEDYDRILDAVSPFKTVIVENHPRLCGQRCLSFASRLQARGQQLEVAMGLETIHPEVLPRLNKQMTLDDFARSCERLLQNSINVRAFILLRPPFLSEAEGVEWALKTMTYAFELGVGCCSVIPTRAGNGIMEQLQTNGWFAPPSLRSMEFVQSQAIRWNRGRVFMDTWDAALFSSCQTCQAQRIENLRTMNLTQQPVQEVDCPNC